jgi:copper chaperone CopZ
MRTETLKVNGMTCGSCVNSVTKALKSVGGVRDVAVSLDRGEARIEFNESSTSPERLRAAVRQAGYEVDVAGGKGHAKAGCCS